MVNSDIILDDSDRVLVSMLQENPRASYQELATATGLSTSTARRRIDRLVGGGVLKFAAVLRWPHFGLRLTAFIALSVDLKRLLAIGDEIAAMDEVVFVALTTGAFDLLAEVVLPTNEDLVRFVTQRVAPIEGIRNLQTFMVPEFIKSFEQFRLSMHPSPLYQRTEDGSYTFSEASLTRMNSGLVDAALDDG
jgi:Lrp/AsnC family transcriptional regulator for asnA, asnC and gidA